MAFCLFLGSLKEVALSIFLVEHKLTITDLNWICQVRLQPDPFLNELTSMFERTTEHGSVWVTLKHCEFASSLVFLCFVLCILFMSNTD